MHFLSRQFKCWILHGKKCKYSDNRRAEVETKVGASKRGYRDLQPRPCRTESYTMKKAKTKSDLSSCSLVDVGPSNQFFLTPKNLSQFYPPCFFPHFILLPFLGKSLLTRPSPPNEIWKRWMTLHFNGAPPVKRTSQCHRSRSQAEAHAWWIAHRLALTGHVFVYYWARVACSEPPLIHLKRPAAQRDGTPRPHRFLVCLIYSSIWVW